MTDVVLPLPTIKILNAEVLPLDVLGRAGGLVDVEEEVDGGGRLPETPTT